VTPSVREISRYSSAFGAKERSYRVPLPSKNFISLTSVEDSCTTLWQLDTQPLIRGLVYEIWRCDSVQKVATAVGLEARMALPDRGNSNVCERLPRKNPPMRRCVYGEAHVGSAAVGNSKSVGEGLTLVSRSARQYVGNSHLFGFPGMKGMRKKRGDSWLAKNRRRLTTVN